MTEKHRSEEELFEIESELGVIASSSDKSSKKRLSFGPRLPIKMSNSGEESSTHSSPQATPSRTTGSGAKTVIGSKLGGNADLVGTTFKTVIDDKTVEFNIWTDVIRGTNAKTLYRFVTAISRSNVFDGASFIENISYQGFNREFYIINALKTISMSMFIRFAILGAVRGSNFAKIVETCIEMPVDMIALHNTGRIVKRAKKRTDLTILRFTASVPQWCAYWMHAAQVEKKIASEACPGWLQFPGAASLPMSEDLRKQHLKFSMAFSKILPGGSFNENIYITAYNNMIPLDEVPESMRMALGVTTIRDAQTLSNDNILDIAGVSNTTSRVTARR